MTPKKIGLTLVVLFLAVGLAGCADTASDDDQIESDDETGDDVEADPADNESDDTEPDSETEFEPDESEEGADGSNEGNDDTIESDDAAVPEEEDSEDAEFEENESEAIEEEDDAVEEEERDSIGGSVTTVDDFEQEVTNEGIDVHTVDFDEDGSLAWSLFEYHSNENVEAGETDELRVIAKAYAGLIDDGYQTNELEVAQMDPNAAADYPWAFYRIDTEWAEDYNEGSISEEEYIELIVDNYEVIEYE